MKKFGAFPTGGIHVAASAGPLQRIASMTKYGAGETIYFQRQRSDHWFRMVTGAARECSLNADGRRQVVGFLLPGDTFGFSTGAVRNVTGEIIAESLVECFPRGQAEVLAESDILVSRKMREMAYGVIDRMQARTLLLGCDSAVEKVCAFLLEMSARSHAALTEDISLPMSRYDIADYLGLAVETVSRTFTALRRAHVIGLIGARQVRVLDQERLERFGHDAVSQTSHAYHPYSASHAASRAC